MMKPLTLDMLLEMRTGYVMPGSNTIASRLKDAGRAAFNWMFAPPKATGEALLKRRQRRDQIQKAWRRNTDAIRSDGTLVKALNKREGDIS